MSIINLASLAAKGSTTVAAGQTAQTTTIPVVKGATTAAITAGTSSSTAIPKLAKITGQPASAVLKLGNMDGVWNAHSATGQLIAPTYSTAHKEYLAEYNKENVYATYMVDFFADYGKTDL